MISLQEKVETEDIEKILQAIKNQRWYFFKNNEYILFDRYTALIWANLNYFPYESTVTHTQYDYDKDCFEIENLIENTNLTKWGNFNGWRIPKPDELWKMIEDKTFPFQKGYCWQICDKNTWCVYKDERFFCYELINVNVNTYSHVNILPCSSSLVPKNLIGSMTPKDILGIFTKNGLIPIFNHKSVNELYEKVYTKVGTFNYFPILSKYDLSATSKSPIKYFESILSLSDELLGILDEYETAQSETIAEFLKIALKLNEKYLI